MHVLESNAILWTIKARELTIVKYLLGKVTLKDENKEPIHKEEIETIQLQIEKLIKNIKKMYDKKNKVKSLKDAPSNSGEFSELDLLERSLYGIPKIEIT